MSTGKPHQDRRAPMTLQQLQAFVSAYQNGSFTAAARELGIAQPSLSELVRRLEHKLGMDVFHRGGRRLVPTVAGEEFFSYALQAVGAASQGLEAVRSLSSLGGGTATFGLLKNADFYHLADLAKEFHRLYPKVRIRLVGQNSADTAVAVAAGEIEAGLVTLPVDDMGLKVKPLIRDEIVYVTSDPDSARRPITIEDFADRRLVLYDAHYGTIDPARRQLAGRAQLAGVRIEPIIEVEHLQTALSFVVEGMADTIAARAAVESSEFPRQLSVSSFDRPIYDIVALIHRGNQSMSPATKEMARLAEEIILKHNPTKRFHQ